VNSTAYPQEKHKKREKKLVSA